VTRRIGSRLLNCEAAEAVHASSYEFGGGTDSARARWVSIQVLVLTDPLGQQLLTSLCCREIQSKSVRNAYYDM
jgi:hypothetical protein